MKQKLRILNALLIDYESSPYVVLQTVEARIIPLLVDSCTGKSSRKLAEVAMQMLTRIADLRYGASMILSTAAMEHFIKHLNNNSPSVLTFHIVRFFEILCQYPEAAYRFQDIEGVKAIMRLLALHYHQPLLCNLNLITIRCFYNYLRTLKTVNELQNNKIASDYMDVLIEIMESEDKSSNQRLNEFTQPLRNLVRRKLGLAVGKCLSLVGRKQGDESPNEVDNEYPEDEEDLSMIELKLRQLDEQLEFTTKLDAT
jgi:hypothetical protein